MTYTESDMVLGILKKQAWLYCCLLLLASCWAAEDMDKVHIHSMLDANIPHLDPIHSTNKYSSTVNASIFEGLYHYHYIKRPLSLEPLLAASLPTTSQDGLTYTIPIKKGVFFHDDPAFKNSKGRELTADDFVYSWKRLADPKNKALGWWVLDDRIQGLNDWRKALARGKADYGTAVEGLKAIDSHTLRIKLTRPSPNFLHRLAMPVTMVVAKEVVKKYGREISQHPVGTGPFLLKKWVRNSRVELIRNENYRSVPFPETHGQQREDFKKYQKQNLPLADRITIHIYREQQPQWLNFLKGRLDHATIPRENMEQIFDEKGLTEKFQQKGIRILDQSLPDVTYIAFNMEDTLLGKNKKLRQAMAHAINKKVILEKFYNSRGHIAVGPIPPGVIGHDPTLSEAYEYDLEKAKKLLSEAGYPKGENLPILEYHMPNVSSWARQFAEYLKSEWEKIGVRVKLVSNTWPEFDRKIKEKKAGLFDMAWMADYPDGENFLQLFYSRNISPGPNNTNFINRKYDELYQKSQRTPPGPERDKLYRQMSEFIQEEVPSIFMLHRKFKVPYHSWLENFNPSPLIYNYHKYLSIDKDEKKRLLKKMKK